MPHRREERTAPTGWAIDLLVVGIPDLPVNRATEPSWVHA